MRRNQAENLAHRFANLHATLILLGKDKGVKVGTQISALHFACAEVASVVHIDNVMEHRKFLALCGFPQGKPADPFVALDEHRAMHEEANKQPEKTKEPGKDAVNPPTKDEEARAFRKRQMREEKRT